MKFGVSFGEHPPSLSLETMRAAEDAGFDQAWMFDSHVLWNECFSVLGSLTAQSRSSRMEFGTLVNNPQTRDPIVTASAFATLNHLTGGRMICGIGRGDSSVRLLGRKPSSLAELEHAVQLIRALGSGETARVDGADVRLEWAAHRLPVYVGAYGPKALRLAGRVGDGVIFQVADPFFIAWGLGHVRAGAEEAGRDFEEIVVHAAAPTFIGDDHAAACEEVRWFPAVVGNHIADVLRHQEDMPEELSAYVADRAHYDYREHGEQGTEHSQYVPDDICERFCIIGTRDEVLAKLRELAAVGVDEINLYPHVTDFPGVIARYGREIIPALREEVATPGG
jgi:probable F420-dependent oxidoreductase